MSDRADSIEISARAKINIYLDVKGRRDDGYHDIETVMLPVSLEDELVVAIEPEGPPTTRLDTTGIDVNVPMELNLAWRAAELFREEAGYKGSITIDLVKNVPPGSGMGGGSSDAAAVMRALDQLLDTRFGLEKLASFAARIGSDVPFFIYDSLAVCTGRGEQVQPVNLKSIPCMWYVIAIPPVEVETGSVYDAWSKGYRIPSPYSGARDFLKRWLAWKDAPFHNSLWEAARHRAPILEKYKMLLPGFSWTLTGTGSAFFTPLREKNDAHDIMYRFPEEVNFRTFLVHAVLEGISTDGMKSEQGAV
ncbi:MAG: 4-(cytidine 5'-diphospho)-2-C-methyl-D-erythritol kinase [Planctomycetota bacterium]|nr:4-(cytidine 5'-diphospho)-2-C-methyl-D-erythritol kinase [Planctomycetota bacterium]